MQIAIEQQRFTRSVAVSAQITGEPAAGYNVVSVSVSPPTVTISGSQSLIDGTTTIATKSIDLDGATDDVVRTVSLDLPTGGEVTGGPPSVTVTVEIAPAEGVFMFAVPITASGLGGDVTIVGALQSVTVTLFGPLPALHDVSPNDIIASIDVSGDDAGQYRKQVVIKAPAGLTVRSVNPTEITVTLEKR